MRYAQGLCIDRRLSTVTAMRAPGALAVILLISACNLSVPDPVVGPAPQHISERFMPEPPGYRVESWIANLEAPWSLVFLPDGRALVSERPGRIRLIRNGKLADVPYASFDVASGAETDLLGSFLSVFADGEGGLMGLAVHPDFPRSPYLYAMQTYSGPKGVKNRIIRLRDEGDRGRFDRVIFDGLPGRTFHNGGRIRSETWGQYTHLCTPTARRVIVTPWRVWHGSSSRACPIT